MKTATVTWVSYNNYGTLLQAYALQKAIEQLGHENTIISDLEIINEQKSQRPTAIHVHQNSMDEGLSRLKRLLQAPGRLPRILLRYITPQRYELPYTGSQAACNRFRDEDLAVLYGQTSWDLSGLNDCFDTFVCGSDQVWSVHEHIFNPYYYLNFATGKKVAYAPSLGADRIPAELEDTVRSLVCDFHALSLRERISADQLASLTGKHVEWVADPTLLHNRTFWEQFCADAATPRKPYLLCYFLENRDWYFERAKKLARQQNLKIVLIPSKWDYLSNEYVTATSVGPKEFVALFQKASYVLTDSYHGSIFSLIFQRDFQYLLRFEPEDPKSQNVRIQSLYDYLSINDRIIFQNHTDPVPLQMDHSACSEKIALLRDTSLAYLAAALQ